MPRAGESGLTLVEMLVVLAIIGIVGSAAALAVGSDRGVNVEAEARRLARAIELAGDEAMITDRAVAFAWDTSSYTFSQGGRRELPASVHLSSGLAKPPIVFSAEGNNPPLSIGLASDGVGWRIDYDGFDVTVVSNGR